MYESLLKSNFIGLSNFYKTPSYENEKSNVHSTSFAKHLRAANHISGE